MSAAFFILALVTVLGAAGAMSLRRLVYCAFCLVGAFAALAGIYLQLDAEFVGLAQILVYVGAVAILVVFAILLTRGAEDTAGESPAAGGWTGLLVAAVVFVCLALLIGSSAVSEPRVAPEASATVRAIGLKLMQEYVTALEVIGVLLTAALIGAVIIAMHERVGPPSDHGAATSEGSAGRAPETKEGA